MRDKRKSEEYFDKFLGYQYTIINKNKNKLAETHDQVKRQRRLMSLVNFYIDLIKAEFSAGADKKKLADLLLNVCKAAAEYKKNVSETLLILMSLAIMLDQRDAVKELIKKNESLISADRLLSYFAGVITSNDGKWDSSINLPAEYAWLDNIFKTEDSEAQTRSLINYLKNWYQNHSNEDDYAWYDSDKSDEDIYSGYWSFESAALVKILGLNEQDFKDLEYYPAL